MKTSLLSLQTALFSALTNHTPLMDKVEGVFDDVPEWLDEAQTIPLEPPYVVIGNPTVIDWGSRVLIDGEQITFTLHVWSDHKGKKEVYEIFNLILEALSNPLSLDSGFFMEFQQREFMEVIDDPEDLRHGIIRFRFTVTQ